VARNDFAKDFGERVRKLREARGFSQEDLGFRAGLHRTHISFVERAKRSAKLETIEKIARALEVEPAALMPKLRRA
jgi:transcriptional regulator with XRE-family HTH domain